MFIVYVIRSLSTGQLYVGLTADLKKRLIRHNSGRNISTRTQRPWELMFSERFPDRLAARSREKFFKTGNGRRTMQLILARVLKGQGGPAKKRSGQDGRLGRRN